LKAYDLADGKTSVLGDYLPTMLQLDKDESILKVIIVNDYNGSVLFAFENGKVARIDVEAYQTKTKRSKLINAFSTESNIISIMYIQEDIDLVCVSNIDKVLICNTSEINSKATKNSMGVNTLRSKNDSTMTLCVPLSSVEGIADVSYYKSSVGAIGCYKKKNDKIILK
jgi:DNA gyrase subunit A